MATPLGNLLDFSPRGRMALEKAHWILCEDTRRSAQLLSSFGIAAEHRLKRLDAHTEAKQTPFWIDQLKQGASLALVSDAGTPSVSDPGSILVAHCHEQGIRVTPIPGASSATTLLSVCGFSAQGFTFRGFFPRESSAQREEIEQARSLSASGLSVWIWFESPRRIEAALQQIALLCDSNTAPSSFEAVAENSPVRLVVGKELTKLHEKLFVGTPSQVLAQVSQELKTSGEIGEWCFSLCFQQEKKVLSPQEDWEESQPVFQALICLQKASVSASETARILSQQFGVPKNFCYQKVIQYYQYKKTEK